MTINGIETKCVHPYMYVNVLIYRVSTRLPLDTLRIIDGILIIHIHMYFHVLIDMVYIRYGDAKDNKVRILKCTFSPGKENEMTPIGR